MKLVIQRVLGASVRVGDAEAARIGRGLVVLAGVEIADGEEQAGRAAEKIAGLRLFPSAGEGEPGWSRNVLEIDGEILLVSQFTLAGSIMKGRRPSFDGAAPPGAALPIYERLAADLRQKGARVATGVFGAMMQVELVNDGPVTFILEVPA